jgi:hypothetical protein
VIRRAALQDAVRSYTVLVDDDPVGKIGPFGSGDFPVSPGHHTLQLRLPGTGDSGSAKLDVDVLDGQVRIFHTKKLGWKKFWITPLAIFFPDRFAPRPWIELELEP